MRERGVGTDLMVVHDGQPSGRAIIQTTPDGEVRFFPSVSWVYRKAVVLVQKGRASALHDVVLSKDGCLRGEGQGLSMDDELC